MRILLGFVLCLAILALAAIAFIYSGIYNVSAMQPHAAPVYWALDTTMHSSVKNHAERVVVPARFTEEQMRSGLQHFNETCVQCHGAPGVEPGELGRGLRPDPPPLSEAVKKWSTAELFWIVKHGIKMAGMPAFGPTHSDEELWEIVAFLDRLPAISPEEYARIAKGQRHGETEDHSPAGQIDSGDQPEES